MIETLAICMAVLNLLFLVWTFRPNKYDGTFHIRDGENRRTITMELETEPDDLIAKKALHFKVNVTPLEEDSVAD